MELFSKEIEIIESNTRCELNSEYMEKMVKEEVGKRSKELDELVSGLKTIIFSDTEELTSSELESCCMKLSLVLFEFETQSEYASIRADIAKMLKSDKFNYLVIASKQQNEKITVQQSQALAYSQVQVENATEVLYTHVMKLLTNKKTSAYELLATIKKVLTSRIASIDGNV